MNAEEFGLLANDRFTLRGLATSLSPHSIPKGWSGIELNDVNRHSPWPARLLGQNDWLTCERTREKVQQEYDREKYSQCLSDFTTLQDSGVTPTFDQIKKREFLPHDVPAWCVSVGQSLRLAPPNEAIDHYYSLVAATLLPNLFGCQAVIELGCGYGYNLFRLYQAFPNAGIRFIGGEYSANAVALGKALSADRFPLELRRFDYYDPNSLAGVFDDFSGRALVFTCHSVEQLPRAQPMLDNLRAYRDRITAVVHLEPITEVYPDTLLGLLRKRYAQVNDYNCDLLSELTTRRDVRIEMRIDDVFGLNPFNPTSIIRWVFT